MPPLYNLEITEQGLHSLTAECDWRHETWDLRRSLGPRFSLGCLETARAWAHRPQTTGQTRAPGAKGGPTPFLTRSLTPGQLFTETPGIVELTPKIIAFSAQELVCLCELFSRHLRSILLSMDESFVEVTWCSVMSCSGRWDSESASNWKLNKVSPQYHKADWSLSCSWCADLWLQLGLVLHCVNGAWFKSHFNFEKKVFWFKSRSWPLCPVSANVPVHHQKSNIDKTRCIEARGINHQYQICRELAILSSCRCIHDIKQ